MITSADIYPLAQRLHGLIPERLRRWTGSYAEPAERDRLADAMLAELTEAPAASFDRDDPEAYTQAIVMSEALAGFVTLWGCRYGNLDDDVDRAQDALVTAIGGTVIEPGYHLLREGTPITVAAIAHLIGWVCILEVPEGTAG